MPDIPQIFTDGIANIALQNGAVRIDYYTLQPGDTESSAKTVTNRMVMSTESFLQNFTSMETVIKQMIDRGLISRKSPEAGDTLTAE